MGKMRYHLSKEYKLSTLVRADEVFDEINKYFESNGISSIIENTSLFSLKNNHVKGIIEGVSIEAFVRTEFTKGDLLYIIEFDKNSLDQRKKADELLSVLVKYNPKPL